MELRRNVSFFFPKIRLIIFLFLFFLLQLYSLFSIFPLKITFIYLYLYNFTFIFSWMFILYTSMHKHSSSIDLHYNCEFDHLDSKKEIFLVFESILILVEPKYHFSHVKLWVWLSLNAPLYSAYLISYNKKNL